MFGLKEPVRVNGVNYGVGYGRTCKSWDKDVSPFCRRTDFRRGAFCDEDWMFVSSSTEGATRSVAFSNPPTGSSDGSLYYSYVICNSIDYFTPNECACLGTTQDVDLEGQDESYGAFCAPWDMGTFYCSISDTSMPAWCGMSWCYSSPDCAGSHASIFYPNSNLSYNYATCGSASQLLLSVDESKETELGLILPFLTDLFAERQASNGIKLSIPVDMIPNAKKAQIYSVDYCAAVCLMIESCETFTTDRLSGCSVYGVDTRGQVVTNITIGNRTHYGLRKDCVLWKLASRER